MHAREKNLNLAILLVSVTVILSATTRAAESVLNQEALCAAILAPPTTDTLADREIKKFQAKVREGRSSGPYLVRLGWAFVSKARTSGDPGYYKLAELCAQVAGNEDETDAQLLRGHIADALHKFADAEVIARKLIEDQHPRWESFALLGDALMEQGKLEEAIAAYQRMVDLRPCSQTYARVAHIRWLKGDLDGAIELMRIAVEASTTRDPEPAAWAYTRLGLYQLQAGNIQDATWSAKRATEFVADYPAALVLQAKLLLNENKFIEAQAVLKRAVAVAPLPEYQWFLADVARNAGDMEFATKTDALIVTRGKAEDNRSFALFLATRNQNADEALQAARQELENRHDVFTYDALAWASFAAGRWEDASHFSKKSLSEGTHDARLQAHAAIIAAKTKAPEAKTLLQAAMPLRLLLLPSERQLLDAISSNTFSAASGFARPTTTTQTMQITSKK